MNRTVRSANAAEVLRTVLLRGPIARSRIAEETGLSPATITRQYAQLAARGLVVELAGDHYAQPLGRPRVPVDLNVADWAVLGVHIGLRRSTFGLLNLRGAVLAVEEVEHEDGSAHAVIEQSCRRLGSIRTGAGADRRVLGLGVVTGGRVDPATGVLAEQPALGWQRLDLRGEFARRTGLRVHVDNNVRAMAGAEVLFGAARGAESLGYLFVGNVLGFASGAEGVVRRGPRAAAGEITHLPLGIVPGPDETEAGPCVCGVPGCFLSLAGERQVAERAVRLGLVAEPRLEFVLAAARAGDERADRLLRERARRIGAAVAILADAFDPELFVLAGQALTDAEEYLPELRASVAARSRTVADPVALVAPTAFGAQVTAVAAASVVIDRVLDDPLELPPDFAAPSEQAARTR